MKREMIDYALLDGEMVYVDDVPNGKACGCICPNCGEGLEACNGGRVKQHYFRHQSGTECEHARDGMLHRLAEEHIKRAFDESEVFNITYFYHSYCKHVGSCKYVSTKKACYDTDRTEKCINLKEWYDSCELERPYDEMNRRSDLKLTSKAKPQRRPLYIEIFVTHKSDEEKLNSDHLIVETKIRSIADIDAIVANGIEEGVDEEGEGTVLYNFRKKDYECDYLDRDIVFVRGQLYKSGKLYVNCDSCKCSKLEKQIAAALPSRETELHLLCFLRAFFVPSL